MNINLFFILTLLFVSACSKNATDSYMQTESAPMVSRASHGFGGAPSGAMMAKSMSASPMSDSVADSAPSQSSVQDIERKLIKNGSLTLQVNSLSEQSEALGFIKSLADKHSVTFDREDESKWGNRATISLTARVPAEQFETYLKSISAGPFKVTAKSVNVSEVTDQYIDLEVRLENKKELRAKYLSILKSATVVKDILAINKSIEEVTSEIESTEGQFRYLKKQIAYSTLNIEITAELPVSMKDQNSFLFEAWRSLQEGWQRVKYFTLGLIGLWPFMILIGLVVWAIKLWRKKRNED